MHGTGPIERLGRTEVWVKSGRTTLPKVLATVPVVSLARSWYFHTLDMNISFGAYKPKPNEAFWGLNMFAVGTLLRGASVQGNRLLANLETDVRHRLVVGEAGGAP
jgi:hypothetical protein